MKRTIIIIMSASFIIGVSLLVFQGFDREYIINVKIEDIRDSKIIVTYGEQNGDPVLYEIDKPSNKEIKKGDYITINNKNDIPKYDAKNREFLLDIATWLLAIPVMFLTLYEFCHTSVDIIKDYKESRK